MSGRALVLRVLQEDIARVLALVVDAPAVVVVDVAIVATPAMSTDALNRLFVHASHRERCRFLAAGWDEVIDPL